MPSVTGALLQWPATLDAEALTTAQALIVPFDVEQLRADLLRAVRKACGASLADQAEDLAQIAVSRVLARLDATTDPVEISPGYLYRAAYSVVIDEIRRRRRRPEVQFDPELPTRSTEPDPERRAIGREAFAAVRECLSGLASARRRAVTLHLLGHSLGEISALLACDRKQAENFVYRGLADLRACLRARDGRGSA